MLCGCVYHLMQTRKTSALVRWFSSNIENFDPDHLEFYEDKLRYGNASYSDDELIVLLSSGKVISTDNVALWSICRFVDDDINKALRLFVKKETGISIEYVPFTAEEAGIAAMCDRTNCSGTDNSSDWIKTYVEKDRFIIILPIDSPQLRQFFIKRLKMVVQYASAV